MKAPMSETSENSNLPVPTIVHIRKEDLDALLGLEWLLANKIGAYASSTVIGCNTRRYHGLLVGARVPPAGRIAALSTVMEELCLDSDSYELATNEFPGTFAPHGVAYLAEFHNDVAPTFVYRIGAAELTKEIVLAEAANVVALRYTLRGASGRLHLRPFVALRGYHDLRRRDDGHRIAFDTVPGGVVVQDRNSSVQTLHLISREAAFRADPQWWNDFRYRVDIARGQSGLEDLYTPGRFICSLADGEPCQFTASLGEPIPLGAGTTLAQRRGRLEELAGSVGPDADEATRRLAVATDAFVARRTFPDTTPGATILAGFPWFADWGRDAFIALPGLLLTTGRFDLAREVFQTFAGHLGNGMIPNRFEEYSSGAQYNSIDASLWFVVAAERYVAAGGDRSFWRDVLMPTCDTILTAYREGTQFDIHAGADGLLVGGSQDTQLTWMDAALGEEVITPRSGKAVEVNALWHSAHRIMADRCRGIDDALAGRYAHLAELIGMALVRTFWNDRDRCLYDCVSDAGADEAIRPNQILAVSLPHCPLPAEHQRDVVQTVMEHLLTPRGLRTLSPADARYRGRCGGSWESRDRAYHQGTVWAWLMGPFVEAYLQVEGYRPAALARADEWLAAFDPHLDEVCIGYVSEVFDGDAPHTPRGCFAQAWSVAELLRARQLVRQHARADSAATRAL